MCLRLPTNFHMESHRSAIQLSVWRRKSVKTNDANQKESDNKKSKQDKDLQAFLSRPCCKVKKDSAGNGVCRHWNFGKGRCSDHRRDFADSIALAQHDLKGYARS